MRDLLLVIAWIAVTTAGLGIALAARGAGLPRTYVRDLLHVGAAVWVLGWPYWSDALAPLAILVPAAAAIGFVPRAGRRHPAVARLVGSISGADESWTGIALYVLAYTILTPIGLVDAPLPAAAALLSLSFGDGLGGLVGRAAGRLRYRVPGAKPKTLEGSLVVAIVSALATLAAARFFDVAIAPWIAVGAGVVAAVAEAVAPRSSDNLLVPAAVWLFLKGVGR